MIYYLKVYILFLQHLLDMNKSNLMFLLYLHLLMDYYIFLEEIYKMQNIYHILLNLLKLLDEHLEGDDEGAGAGKEDDGDKKGRGGNGKKPKLSAQDLKEIKDEIKDHA